MMIQLISSDELARQCGYESASSAFREWCASLRIRPVPGRRGYYDPALVRRRLDEAQGLVGALAAAPIQEPTPVQARRARHGAG